MYGGFALLDHSLLLMDIHVMIVIDSCQKMYPLTSVTWLYRGLKCTTHLHQSLSLRCPCNDRTLCY